MAEALFYKTALQIETKTCGKLSVGKIGDLPMLGPAVPDAVSNSIVYVVFNSLQDFLRAAHAMSQLSAEMAWNVLLPHAHIEKVKGDLRLRLLKKELRSPSSLRKRAKAAFAVYLFVEVTVTHERRPLRHSWSLFGHKATRTFEQTQSELLPTNFEVTHG